MKWFCLKKSLLIGYTVLCVQLCMLQLAATVYTLYCSQLKQLMLASNGWLRTTTCCHVTWSICIIPVQSLLLWVLWPLPCFMACQQLKIQAIQYISIAVMFILTYQFLWFWSHSKDLHDPENNLWYSIITYVTHEGWITPTLRIYILSFSSITIVF